MSISTRELNTSDRKPGKFISYGCQLLKINDIIVNKAATGSKVCRFEMETKPILDAGFEGQDGALGRVGRVQFPRTYVTTDPKKREEFLKNICIIADKLGVREQVDAIGDTIDNLDGDNFDLYVSKVKPFLIGKYAYWVVGGEEYPKTEGGSGWRLALVRYGFVQDEKSYLEKPRIDFDINSEYHYKALEKADETDADKKVLANDDLPF